MAYATMVNIGNLVAEIGLKYVGAPSAPHRRFHTGIKLAEGQKPGLKIDLMVEQQLTAKLTGHTLDDYSAHKYELHLPHSPEIGLDCSGLANLVMEEALKRSGVVTDVPRHVKGFYIWALTDFLPTDSLEVGDLLFSCKSGYRVPPSHIGICVGKREVVTSPGTEGGKIEVVLLEQFTTYGLVAVKRLKI